MERGKSSKGATGAAKTSRANKSSASTGKSAAMGKRESNSLLKEFFVEQLQDILWAEKALVQALPKMQGATTTKELAEEITAHLSETENHINRLEQVFDMMGVPAKAKKCEAMDGLIKEANNIIEETGKGTATRDAAIIMAIQKMEHYEIATYGSLVQLAKTIGMNDVAELLAQTLAEEKGTDQALTQIAESNINEEGAQEQKGKMKEDDDQHTEEGSEGEED